MSTRVGVVAVGRSAPALRRGDVDYAELVLEAVDEALAAAGVDLGDLEHAVTASLDFLDGRTIASMSAAEVVGSYLKPEARLCGDGTGAVLYALARMRTNAYRLGLVVAHAKESQGRPDVISNAAFDPYTERELGPTAEVVAGLAAQRFHAASGRSEKDAAAAVVAARVAGRGNRHRVTLPDVTVEDVLGAPLLASPLRALDQAPRADAACALVVATEDVARGLGVTPVWIAGAAVSTDAYWLHRDLARTAALEAAAASATAMAGWDGAAPDVVEVSAEYGYQVLQFAPPLGVRPDAVGPAMNPSGGRLAGVPQVVAGLEGVAECVEQLRGTAGARQVPGAARALAHGFHGLAAQTHGVVALEADA